MLVVPTLGSRDGHRLLPDFLRPQRLGKNSEDQTGSSPQGSGWKWKCMKMARKKLKKSVQDLQNQTDWKILTAFVVRMLFLVHPFTCQFWDPNPPQLRVSICRYFESLRENHPKNPHWLITIFLYLLLAYNLSKPSRELTYPSLGKGKSSSKVIFDGNVSYQEGNLIYSPFRNCSTGWTPESFLVSGHFSFLWNAGVAFFEGDVSRHVSAIGKCHRQVKRGAVACFCPKKATVF